MKINDAGRCGKRAYSTKRLAKKSRMVGGKKLMPYLCPNCDKYHLTSQKQRNK